MIRTTTTALLLTALPALALADALPSWNDGEAKTAILDFVAEATTEGSAGFVPEADRIAVFDNDGTLWSEQPVYFQLFFGLDLARQRAEEDPAWASTPALQAAAAGDVAALAATGMDGLLEMTDATVEGLSFEEFTAAAAEWLGRAEHPVTGRPFTEMVYQPMLELLDHLRDNGFETFIVSGGGVDFMRAFTEEAYGIPPQNVIGSMGNASFRIVDGVPQVMKEPGVAFIDDEAGKPVGIARHIGKRPVFVAGNSDGDLEMLQWGTTGELPSLGIIVHHTDAAREWAYDRDSHIGRLNDALDLAPEAGWIVVDMAGDWATVWPGTE